MCTKPLLAALAVVLALPTVGFAKGPAPFRVSTPDGHSFVVDGEEARDWWEELWANPDPPPGSRCCTSPRSAARYAGVVWKGWDKRAAEVPEPYLIHSGWTGLFYPSTESAPAYIVMPIAQGGGGRRWPSWRRATDRMEEIILSGARQSFPTHPAGISRGQSHAARRLYTGLSLAALALAGVVVVDRFPRGRRKRIPVTRGREETAA